MRRGLVDTQVRSETGGMEGANGLSPMGKGMMVLEGGRVLALVVQLVIRRFE